MWMGVIILLGRGMSVQVREDELYEDLSIMLVMIRKLFKHMLLRDTQQDISRNKESLNEEALINSRCAQLTIKYRKASIRKLEFVHIISRFMCRVKEILKQIVVCVPKEKVQTAIVLKKMELLTLKPITPDTASALILSLLETIGSCNAKLAHSLRIRPASPTKEHKGPSQRLADKQSSCREESVQQKGRRVQITQSELNVMTKQLEKYSVMGVDRQFFRGRYFDMKTDQAGSIFEESMFRNRNIKNIMTRFEKDYSRHTAKSSSNTLVLKSTEDSTKKRTICWEITPLEQEPSNLLTAKREASRGSNSPRIPLNKSNQTLPASTLEASAELGIETYRSMYESRVMKSRGKKTIKMNNTIIDVPSAVASPNAPLVNAKRWNFYKKSQEHLKFRYKYTQHKTYYTPIQAGGANPELFYTITR